MYVIVGFSNQAGDIVWTRFVFLAVLKSQYLIHKWRGTLDVWTEYNFLSVCFCMQVSLFDYVSCSYTANTLTFSVDLADLWFILLWENLLKTIIWGCKHFSWWRSYLESNMETKHCNFWLPNKNRFCANTLLNGSL